MKFPFYALRRWVVLLAAWSLLPALPVAVTAEVDYSQRIVSFFLIGGSSTNIVDRRVAWNLRQIGWQGFVQTRIRPQLDAGVRRIQIHNPFGTLPEEPMQFDQFLHARDAGLDFLIDDFVKAWRPVVQGIYTEGEPVEVIAYLGKLEDDPDFAKLLDKGDTAGWLARAIISMSLPLEAGMSIGFDAAAPASEQSPTHHLTQLVKSLGVRIYIEARPYQNTPHWFDENIIITDTFWKRSDPERYPDDSGKWAARNDQLKGEIVHIIFPEHADDPENWKLDLRRVLNAGHTAAVPIYNMVDKDRPLKVLPFTPSR